MEKTLFFFAHDAIDLKSIIAVLSDFLNSVKYLKLLKYK